MLSPIIPGVIRKKRKADRPLRIKWLKEKIEN